MIARKPATIEPVCVYGGFQIARCWWSRGRDNGWEWDRDFLSPMIYATEAECAQAITEGRYAVHCE
jgi:hypothetical protein